MFPLLISSEGDSASPAQIHTQEGTSFCLNLSHEWSLDQSGRLDSVWWFNELWWSHVVKLDLLMCLLLCNEHCSVWSFKLFSLCWDASERHWCVCVMFSCCDCCHHPSLVQEFQQHWGKLRSFSLNHTVVETNFTFVGVCRNSGPHV